MEFDWAWFQNHLSRSVVVILTIILIIHYFIEKDTGIRLSKRYRNSIYEAQSRIFLNATQYLISGNKNLAIKEFLNAVDLNRETIETYFALGGLFRSNGEIEKAISIHRSLIARENISEATRLRALKELALDFDKGGLVDKAIETYKDVLEINCDQYSVIQSLCRIYEDIEDWDQAYRYRIMFSKVGQINQAETISHILVQKAKICFEKGNFPACNEDLEEAFLFAPSVSAKILQLKLYVVSGSMDEAEFLLLELLKEHPMYASFIFVSLSKKFDWDKNLMEDYQKRMEVLRSFFLKLNDKDLLSFPSVILSKVRLLKESNNIGEAYEVLKSWIQLNDSSSEVLKAEYVKLLIDLGKKDLALEKTKELLNNLHQSLTKHYCKECGHNSDEIFWRCPQCHEWESIQFRWKV